MHFISPPVTPYGRPKYAGNTISDLEDYYIGYSPNIHCIMGQMNVLNFGVTRSRPQWDNSTHVGNSTLWADTYSTQCCTIELQFLVLKDVYLIITWRCTSIIPTILL